MDRLTACLCAALAAALPLAADTTGWRTDATGRYPQAELPAEWGGGKGVLWRTPLPQWGNATPVVVAGRVLVSQEPAVLTCLDLADGRVLWQQPYGPVAAEAAKPKTHEVNGYATMTPVSDGARAFVSSGLGTAAAFDLEGKKLWQVRVNEPKHQWGTSSSPVLAGGFVIVHIADTVSALDPGTGRTAWTATSAAGWGTSAVARAGGEDLVFTTGGDLLRARDGKVLASRQAQVPWTSPLAEAGVVYVVDEKGSTALKLPEKADAAADLAVLWKLPSEGKRKDRHYATPLLVEGLLYTVTRKGHLSVIEAATGAIVYEQDLDLGGTVYPSPLLAGKEILVGSDTGKIAVLTPGRTFALAGTRTVEGFRACPVIAGRRLLVRSTASLACIGK